MIAKKICLAPAVTGIQTCSLSLFCVRILRFSQAKILGFFSWLSAKKLKRQFVPRACSANQIFKDTESYKMSLFSTSI